MPPKRGKKRKATAQKGAVNGASDDALPSVPDRSTWPGWVEMESEPAFFNVMLKEMGVRGVKIQEVYALEEEMLAILPQPVHALIFLFRYRDTDQAEQEKQTSCPKHIWFANQIPDFACASVALLNIVNNIKGLQMGKELRDFREFTRDMNPMSRGDAIDSFDFVKHIHNSFAREIDLLNADMYLKQKAAKAKKKQATAKARETREAKQSGKTPLKEKSANAAAAPIRTSTRAPKITQKKAKRKSVASGSSSPLSDPPDSDPDFAASSKTTKPPERTEEPQRRSQRTPKPRQDTFAASATPQAEDEEGFHFIAYMPIEGHVWKLDGLNSFPQDMGEVDAATGGDWMNIAKPALQTRMAMYEGADIEFNLMAVVHDPVFKDRRELAENVRQLQAVEKKLDEVVEDWKDLDGMETVKDVITGTSSALDLSQSDIDAAQLSEDWAEKIKLEDDLLKLIDMRKEILSQQGPLRGSIRNALENERADDEKARHRRHDYGKFVRSWLGALAEQELLSDLLDGT